MIERAYCFTCDYCGRYECYLGDNIKEAKHEARLENWIMNGKRGCFCSEECYLEAYRDYARMTKR